MRVRQLVMMAHVLVVGPRRAPGTRGSSRGWSRARACFAIAATTARTVRRGDAAAMVAARGVSGRGHHGLWSVDGMRARTRGVDSGGKMHIVQIRFVGL